MGLASYARKIAAAEEQQPIIADTAKEKEIRASGRALAATVGWLPATPSSDAFSKCCLALTTAFKNVQSAVDAAFSKFTNSQIDEGRLWLRDNAQEFASATRQLSNELGPLVNLPVVAGKDRIIPRVLAIAEGFVSEYGPSFLEREFTAFCMAF